MNSKGKTVVRRRDMGLGSYPEVSLAEARDKARDLRRQVRNGIDPLEQKRREKEAICMQLRKTRTFRECAEAVIENKSRELKSTRNLAFWRASIENHVFPVIGGRAVETISRADVAAVLEPLWHTKHKTAGELRGRIETILDYAIAMEYREGENPAAWKGVLEPILGRVKRVIKPQPSLPYAEIGAFLDVLRKHDDMAARALEFIILTATRPGEVFGATWKEIDMRAKIWTIPAIRMKAGKEHRVPLSTDAIMLLESLSDTNVASSRYIFSAPRGGCMLHPTITRLIRSMHRADIQAGGKGYIDPHQNCVITTHGFRSTFRDWAAEVTTYPREVCEYALAHSLASKVEAAYQRGDMLVKRAQLMDDWARYCRTIQPLLAN